MAKIGPLDVRIRFLTQTANQNSDYGTEGGGWVPHADAWASMEDVMPSKDEKLLQGAMEVGTIKTRLRFRWRDDIDSSMRVQILNPLARTMEIIGGPAQIAGRRRYMEVLCEEVSARDGSG